MKTKVKVSKFVRQRRLADSPMRVRQVMSEAGVDLDEMLDRLDYTGDPDRVARAHRTMSGIGPSAVFLSNVAEVFGVDYPWLVSGTDLGGVDHPATIRSCFVPGRGPTY